jgi:hypothetical protein
MALTALSVVRLTSGADGHDGHGDGDCGGRGCGGFCHVGCSAGHAGCGVCYGNRAGCGGRRDVPYRAGCGRGFGVRRAASRAVRSLLLLRSVATPQQKPEPPHIASMFLI